LKCLVDLVLQCVLVEPASPRAHLEFDDS
jgi:hypothetical protein